MDEFSFLDSTEEFTIVSSVEEFTPFLVVKVHRWLLQEHHQSWLFCLYSPSYQAESWRLAHSWHFCLAWLASLHLPDLHLAI